MAWPNAGRYAELRCGSMPSKTSADKEREKKCTREARTVLGIPAIPTLVTRALPLTQSLSCTPAPFLRHGPNIVLAGGILLV